MKISVITWDGGFREKFHTVDFFTDQTLNSSEYEFIWVEYGGTTSSILQEKIAIKENARIIYVDKTDQYHVGDCMNAGVDASAGELLVLIDGDVVCERDFLENIWAAHQRMSELAIYVRRWDEQEQDHQPDISVTHLREVCRLGNPTNYGGCLTIRREIFDKVGGYETHSIVGGPGAVNMELYIRLRNLGVPIMWHPTVKIYHPWHPGTLPSTDTLQQRMQKWVIEQRAKSLDVEANAQQIDQYLECFEDDLTGLIARKTKRIIKKLPGFKIFARLLRNGLYNA